MSLQPGTPIGTYVVRRKLAEGGMAEIYLCSVRGAEGFEKDVVIKRIRSFLSDDQQFVEMFIAEAKLGQRLNHANIVQIFNFNKHEDTYYLSMEYVRGKSLWDLRKRSRDLMTPLPPTLVAQIGSEVARGLHYAHRLGLVHRDVTPHNVLLSFEGAVKLADFGIAKAGTKLTSPGILKGKFAYMSPEQARGDEVDARTDVFALGIVLWEMLTGARLFDGDSDVAVLKAVQQSVIAPPARLNPDVHPDLDAVVMRALERDPEKRYQTAQELERALGQFILRNAESIDETDVGGFLRRLYADELQQRGDGFDGTASGVSAPSTPAKREPTAVLGEVDPAQSASISQPVSPDEDVHASTWLVRRDSPSDPPLRPTLPARPLLLTDPQPSPAPAQPSSPQTSPQPETRPRAEPSPAPTVPRERASAAVAAAPPGESTAVLQARLRRGRTTRTGLVAGAVLAIGAVSAVVTLRTRQEKSADPRAESLDAGVQAVVPRLEPDSGVVPAAVEPATQVDAGLAETTPEEAGPMEGDDPPATVVRERPVETRRGGRPPARAPGTLVLNVTPWANVFIDGRKLSGDVAGKHEIQLAPGRYLIRFEHPRKTWEDVVTVRSNRRQLVTFDLFGE